MSSGVLKHACCRGVRKWRPKRQTPAFEGGGLFKDKELDDDLLSQMYIHYHRRKGVSLSCSGWEGVVPPCYGRQAVKLGIALAIGEKHDDGCF